MIESILNTIMGDNYDFDHDMLDAKRTAEFVSVLAEMPNYRSIVRDDHTHHSAWDEAQSLYADICVNADETGSYAFTGSENIETV